MGLTYGFRIGPQTYLNLLWASHKQHFARFNFTNIEIMAPWNHGLGIQFMGSLYDFSSRSIWYTITPKYMLPSTDILVLDPGFQVSIKLQVEPHATSGFLFGAEYIYHKQDYSDVKQEYQTILGFLGYRF